MKNIIKPLTAALAYVCICASLASCGTTVDTAVAGGSDTGTVNRQTGAVETEISDGLGAYDFKGSKFNIVYCDKYFFAPYNIDELNGEILNDAAYQRNFDIEQRFNIDLNYIVLPGSAGEVADAVIKSVMAGDGAYDLAITHPFIKLTSLISGGNVLDWNKIPAVNFDKPWWNGTFNKNLAVGKILPCASSDFIYFNSGAIYFNKEMLGSYKLANPYEAVKDGTWTWDKLSAMAKTVPADLNGDGAMDAKDQWGYTIVLNHRMIPVTYSCGMTSAAVSADGTVSLANLNSEKMHNIVSMYYRLLFENPGVFKYKNGDNELELFVNGQSLFMHYVTQNIKALREVDFEWGLLPQPKYDEAQDKYYSLAQSNVMVIPASVEDTERVGVITEALSAESYKVVIPALYEVTFENKYLRDDDSYRMFNIIKNSLVYDVLWNYAEGDATVYFLNNLMENKSADLASFYAANCSKTEVSLNKFCADTMKAYGK